MLFLAIAAYGQQPEMVAIALDVAGVALISAGIVANANMQNSLDKYGKRRKDPVYYEDNWKD